VEESVTVIQRVLVEGGHHDFTIREFPNDDHGMYQVTGDGSAGLDPEYLKTMREWLQAHVLSRP